MTNAADQQTSLDPLWDKAEEAARQGDTAGVLFLWKALADKGAWPIYARIGQIYERGADGIEKNLDQALSWYRKAIFEGDDPVAHAGLGRAYYEGTGVERDYVSALRHFEKAFAAGLPEAGIYLGIMYYHGIGTARDVRRAEKCLEFAAKSEYFFAYGPLARIAFDEGKYLRGARLWVKGWLLGLRLSKTDPDDPRLLGIERPA